MAVTGILLHRVGKSRDGCLCPFRRLDRRHPRYRLRERLWLAGLVGGRMDIVIAAGNVVTGYPRVERETGHSRITRFHAVKRSNPSLPAVSSLSFRRELIPVSQLGHSYVSESVSTWIIQSALILLC